MSELPELVCASANPDKVAEIEYILRGVVQLVPRPAGVPDVVEDADTLEGNARLKAVAICEATGRPSIADDTGLEVVALGGEPGVFSARWAGEGCTYADNRRKLLAELGDAADRRARFRTCALVRWPDGREVAVDGVCDGVITQAEIGDGGFGYDAVFAPVDGDGRTFAQMTEGEKHAISHRGRAFRNLVVALGG
ncbi:MAG: RdgB/HAM1 family non-canonical purine NTP pyrophosphatase [Ilumatobacter sp.]|uniref:RdgB/HAM1 family non-canonical purine NTP pyrophosphatase n=1 Tax=Ilumatobacter sp. TaxID=1967498 RepID=UPI002614509E|nr:RdgB/HAM1 family non-canonical purine NTP pyrophosphatase [Ilumatobacter sp.]MDJ0771000.1 RdgB/HAM1 family non-canonical purine NTP pyrophosphatase [Ilumatobacter sp.]